MAGRAIFTSLIVLCVAGASNSGAQARVQRDSSWRLQRFVHDAGYGIVEGLAYSGLDQLNDTPAEWGNGWPGYGCGTGPTRWQFRASSARIPAALRRRAGDRTTIEHRRRCSTERRHSRWAR